MGVLHPIESPLHGLGEGAGDGGGVWLVAVADEVYQVVFVASHVGEVCLGERVEGGHPEAVLVSIRSDIEVTSLEVEQQGQGGNRGEHTEQRNVGVWHSEPVLFFTLHTRTPSLLQRERELSGVMSRVVRTSCPAVSDCDRTGYGTANVACPDLVRTTSQKLSGRIC